MNTVHNLHWRPDIKKNSGCPSNKLTQILVVQNNLVSPKGSDKTKDE